MAQKLPKELVLHILEYMAVDTMTHVWLHHELCLDVAAEKLLGQSPATEALLPLAAQAVLEQSVLAIDAEFQRTEQGKVAVLPAHVFSLPHPVRKILLTLDFEIPIGVFCTPGGVQHLTVLLLMLTRCRSPKVSCNHLYCQSWHGLSAVAASWSPRITLFPQYRAHEAAMGPPRICSRCRLQKRLQWDYHFPARCRGAS